MLNSVDNNSFSDLISVYLKTIDHLNLKLLIFYSHLQVLRFDCKKFRILEILNFRPYCSAEQGFIFLSFFFPHMIENSSV